MRRWGAVLAVVMVFAAGCGGGDGDQARPSSGELSSAMRSGKADNLGLNVKLTKKAADCVAKALVASDVSDAALESVVKGSKYKLTKADEKALGPLTNKLRDCLADLPAS